MDNSRLEELIQKCVLGIQTASEAEELAAHLEQDDANEARSKLRLALRADAYLQEAAAEMGHDEIQRDIVERGIVASPTSRNWNRFGMLAGIAVLVVIGFVGWLRKPSVSPSEIDLGVATVLRIDGIGHANGERLLARSDTLHAGDELRISDGLVELVFQGSGVHAIAAAPLTLTTESSTRIFLHRGDIKLHVPPQGIGFVVKTAEREITDLGTQFVVTAGENGSQVFVLDGQVAVGENEGSPRRVMTKGDVANYYKDGHQRLLVKKTVGLPELSISTPVGERPFLPGKIFGFGKRDLPKVPVLEDLLGQHMAPLINSGFKNQACLQTLTSGEPLRFGGIAGAYTQYAQKNGLDPDVVSRAGWLAWYQGKVTPPQPGRYRFWGYADNNLLVSVDGKAVFDGSRYDSAFSEIVDVKRSDHPAWPCLNAMAGFASGPWVQLGDEPVDVDILFGEKHGNLTFGLLLVERMGENYETTDWGQPKWPLFLIGSLDEKQFSELDALRAHMEEKLMGSFSVSQDAIWRVEN